MLKAFYRWMKVHPMFKISLASRRAKRPVPGNEPLGRMPTTIFPGGYNLLEAASKHARLGAPSDADAESPDSTPKLLLPPLEGMRTRSFIFGLLVNMAIVGGTALLPAVRYVYVVENTEVPVLIDPILSRKSRRRSAREQAARECYGKRPSTGHSFRPRRSPS